MDDDDDAAAAVFLFKYYTEDSSTHNRLAEGQRGQNSQKQRKSF